MKQSFLHNGIWQPSQIYRVALRFLRLAQTRHLLCGYGDLEVLGIEIIWWFALLPSSRLGGSKFWFENPARARMSSTLWGGCAQCIGLSMTEDHRDGCGILLPKFHWMALVLPCTWSGNKNKSIQFYYLPVLFWVTNILGKQCTVTQRNVFKIPPNYQNYTIPSSKFLPKHVHVWLQNYAIHELFSNNL
jgi:hypothetical protein